MAKTPSPRPPLGWNSWDCYGTTVTEAEVLANAVFMAAHLLPFGWDTVVVDIDWSDPTARSHGYNEGAPLNVDAHGRLQPDPERFPSSAGGAGFAPLAATIHSLGLKFGIHIMRGIPRVATAAAAPILGTSHTADEVADATNRCEWNPHMDGLLPAHPAGQAYYDSIAALYAQWGVDFIKADDMLWPYQAADIEAFALAIERSGRPMGLSLSPGRDLSLTRLDHLREHATMWRICDDLWDTWSDVEANFARFARWAPVASDRGWPDGDMLPLGRIGIRAERGEPRDSRLTPAERVTLMTLWVIARSPLMIGGDLPSSTPETIALFTNADVLAVLDSRGSREVFREGNLVLWTADDADGAGYVAAFNLGDEALTVALDSANVGMPGVFSGTVRELWTGAVLATRPVTVQSDEARGVAPGSTAIPLTIEPHGAQLLRWES
ncbi:Alpha galactosidase A [Sanguibacter gelidistatuariae]|uniref:Alpha-galactosidase n=1 Tax=Sanguibacter gelidistatuariae TaxID=1814289 RepID=A0A1G6GW54_9MICO|nr:glycoside hydrolase family 27 protein [Sanguibacter gelidistatuariae]SDB86171.1 Alpha galactosidase A [Sanguibacter gelidistatuariae]